MAFTLLKLVGDPPVIIGDRYSGHLWSVVCLSTHRSRSDGGCYSVTISRILALFTIIKTESLVQHFRWLSLLIIDCSRLGALMGKRVPSLESPLRKFRTLL